MPYNASFHTFGAGRLCDQLKHQCKQVPIQADNSYFMACSHQRIYHLAYQNPSANSSRLKFILSCSLAHSVHTVTSYISTSGKSGTHSACLPLGQYQSCPASVAKAPIGHAESCAVSTGYRGVATGWPARVLFPP